MKKVLILAYDFPPYFSVGAARPYSWYKYFFENGLYPVVITRHWDKDIYKPSDTILSSGINYTTTETNPEGTIIRCPYKANFRDKLLLKYGDNKFRYFRKIISFIFSYLRFFYFKIDSTSNIYFEAEKYLKSNQISCIIATMEPFILFKYASLLAQQFNTPWIADYRDGFSTNNMIKINNNFESVLSGILNKKLEKNILRNATGITAAAPPYLKDILNIMPFKIKSKIIFNGFDEWNKLSENNEIINTNNTLKIAYSGRLYSHFPVEEFFDSLININHKYPGIKFEINFFGLAFYPDDKKRIIKAANNISSHINIYPRLNYNEYMNQLSESDLLLLFAIPDVNWLNAKIFDYISVNRNILLFKNDNSILNNIITELNAGFIVNNSSELFSILDQIFVDFSMRNYLNPEIKNTNVYSRKHQTSEMVKFIGLCVE